MRKVGLILSDQFLVSVSWLKQDNQIVLKSFSKVKLTEQIKPLLYNEKELSSIITIALRRVSDAVNMPDSEVFVGVDDSFLHHGVMETEPDLAREDYWDYIKWIESNKSRPKHQESSIFGQFYLPEEVNIHTVVCPTPLIRTIKLSISELGGKAKWMGPISSLYLDAGNESDVALILKQNNRYLFHVVQNCRYDTGLISFSSGVPKVSSSSGEENDILSSFKLIESELDDVPIYSPCSLGRQAHKSWSKSDLRLEEPFSDENISSDFFIKELEPHFELNALSKLVKSKSIEFSFNFFSKSKITDFLFTKLDEAIEHNDTKIIDIINKEDELEVKENKSQNTPVSSSEVVWLFLALFIILSLFFTMNYLKFREKINDPLFMNSAEYKIKKTDPVNLYDYIDKKPEYDNNLYILSKNSTKIISEIMSNTDIKSYNNLTITNSFISLEYISGSNPKIDEVISIEPTSFSVEASGEDSTMFLWYYSFDTPREVLLDSSLNIIGKLEFLEQLDSTINDHTIKYFEEIERADFIYEPFLLWVRGEENIKKSISILEKTNHTIILRKFILFNEVLNPSPRAGFYLSFSR